MGSASTPRSSIGGTSPLRVTVLVSTLQTSGGGERLARALAVCLDPKRFRRTLCVSRWSPEQAQSPAVAAVLEELRASGVDFLGLTRSSRWDLLAWRPLVALLRNGTDILHTHMFSSNVWGALLATASRTPVFVAHEHTWSFQGQPLRRLLDRDLIARRSDAFVAVSREDRRRMIEVEGIDPDDVVFVPNGIPPLPKPSGRDPRVELGIPPDDPVIGTVSVLRSQKALPVLIRAAAELHGEFPGLRVLIVGDGPERRRLEKLVAELGLTGCVRLLGHRDDVPDLLTAFDLGVCSSDFEGSPLAVMEYMAAGLAVVATRVGGVPDLIEPEVHGLLVEPGDPLALAEAIGRLLREPRRAIEMGQRGRERQRREFDLEATAQRIAALYESLYASSTLGT